MPASLEANVLSDKAIRLGWQPGFNHTAFRAEYRPVGGEGHWYSSESYLDYLNVDGLRPDTEYEVRLRGHCGTLQGAFTPTRRVRTAKASEKEFACGTGGVIPINNTLPQMQLFEGQTIDAQGFRVRLTEVTGSNGRFSGAGYATVPFLANAKVRVTFSDIFVNEDLQMVRGTIRTVYNPDSPFMVDGDKVQEKIEEKISRDKQEETLPGEDETKEIARTITVDKEIDEVYINDEGMIVVVDSEGNETYYEQSVDVEGNREETVVVDSEGNEWVVGKEGGVSRNMINNGSNDSKIPDSSDLNDFEKIVMEVLDSIENIYIDKLDSLTQPYDSLTSAYEKQVENLNKDDSAPSIIKGLRVLTGDEPRYVIYRNILEIEEVMIPMEVQITDHENRKDKVSSFKKEDKFFDLVNSMKEKIESSSENLKAKAFVYLQNLIKSNE